jgi:energy-converting hydrogenase Eha subunit C
MSVGDTSVIWRPWDTCPKIGLNRLVALLQRRLPSHSSRVEQNTLQRAKRLNLLQSGIQLLQVGDVADPSLDTAAVASLLDGVEHVVFVLGQAFLVPRDQCHVSEAAD